MTVFLRPSFPDITLTLFSWLSLYVIINLPVWPLPWYIYLILDLLCRGSLFPPRVATYLDWHRGSRRTNRSRNRLVLYLCIQELSLFINYNIYTRLHELDLKQEAFKSRRCNTCLGLENNEMQFLVEHLLAIYLLFTLFLWFAMGSGACQ